uniref:Cryptochrome-1 n=1 Tax=Dianemobius nigrofasciatus TaxID=209010 RepID=A2A264_9ORTH|nr:cryptochrome precursor [Dianemobius nigrofasciatus]
MDNRSNVHKKVAVHRFRHGLRLHDNPALLDAVKDCDAFLPIFIFDGESAGTKLVGYNRMKFLLESLQDIDSQLKKYGGNLYLFHGTPLCVFQYISQTIGLHKLCFEQDCEPIWQHRDDLVKKFCKENGIKCIERVSHTLWNPHDVIKTNGGIPPLTFEMFVHTVSVIGPPPRPVEDVEWSVVNFGVLPMSSIPSDIKVFKNFPTPEDFGISSEVGNMNRIIQWIGGESQALRHLQERLKVEENAFREGYCLPNQARPDLLGPPTSQSAALRFGCLSVRKFYWSIQDMYSSICGPSPNQNITSQLIWREYFYTMSVGNEYYAEMDRNPICLNIPWKNDYGSDFNKWKEGKTGYPFIDAIMRQLIQEGWIHHVARNAVACFLTRGDLWISWEEGLNFFLQYLLDADWSVCAGNWMWVSSSAFEQLLDCSHCMCPVNYGRRLDPWGQYIKRYIPELKNYPVEYLYEPWKAPLHVQETAGCIVGKDYPERIIDHQIASEKNRSYMDEIRNRLMNPPPHCRPSSEKETRQFMWFPDDCSEHSSQ